MPTRDILKQLTPILLSAGALLPLTLLIEQYPINLAGPVALIAFCMAESGGVTFLPVIVLAMAVFLLSRAGIPWRQRRNTLAAIVGVLTVFLGGGAYLNEHVVKPIFATPRPCVKELAEITDGASCLGISPAQFYEITDRLGRGDYLREKLRVGGPPMRDCIRSHWIHETGYSFPSGHSFSSMMVATFFLALGVGYFTGTRRRACLALVFWAVAVCYSRPALRVHSAVDVCVGALEGIVVGVTAFLLVRRLIEREVKTGQV